MIHFSASISGVEPVAMTGTEVRENGQAQFMIGTYGGGYIHAYWTVSELVTMSSQLAAMAAELNTRLEYLDHASLRRGAAVMPTVGMDL